MRTAAGPFDGYRLGVPDVPVRIRDLTVEGCLVELSFGLKFLTGRLTLQIDLPGEGWVTVQCDTQHTSGPSGFTVRFVDLTTVIRERIERTIQRVHDRTERGWMLR